jgi:membrane-associated phospholipid phosphatase
MKLSIPNKGFIIPAVIFFIISAVLLLMTEQGTGLRFCSENRSKFWDLFFIYGTKLGEEPVYAILTILGLFISFRFAIKIPFIGFTIMGLSFLLKSIFLHKRPTSYFGDLGLLEEFNMVEGVHLLMGLTSFPSGHTMSGFGLFYLLSLHFNKKIGVGILCFILALIVGFSRIYLFEHFLKDVFFGGICGLIIAQFIDYLFSFKKEDADFWMNKNILSILKNNKVQA